MIDTTKTVEQFADDIMTMIRSAMAEDPRMTKVRSFSELEEFCDANVYLIDAGVPFDLADDEVCAFNGAVEDAVTARLATLGQ